MKKWYRSMTPEKAKKIRLLYFREGKKQHEIAAMFGISQGNVSRIVSGKVW